MDLLLLSLAIAYFIVAMFTIWGLVDRDDEIPGIIVLLGGIGWPLTLLALTAHRIARGHPS